jgi:hypothetical protein
MYTTIIMSDNIFSLEQSISELQGSSEFIYATKLCAYNKDYEYVSLKNPEKKLKELLFIANKLSDILPSIPEWWLFIEFCDLLTFGTTFNEPLYNINGDIIMDLVYIIPAYGHERNKYIFNTSYTLGSINHEYEIMYRTNLKYLYVPVVVPLLGTNINITQTPKQIEIRHDTCIKLINEKENKKENIKNDCIVL